MAFFSISLPVNSAVRFAFHVLIEVKNDPTWALKDFAAAFTPVSALECHVNPFFAKVYLGFGVEQDKILFLPLLLLFLFSRKGFSLTFCIVSFAGIQGDGQSVAQFLVPFLGCLDSFPVVVKYFCTLL